MSRVYDTRFLWNCSIPETTDMYKRIETEKKKKGKYTSAVVIHELYKLTLLKEGRETAKLHSAMIQKSFKVISIDEEIAQTSAELKQKYQLSMGDSMIAPTALTLNAICISDDPHFKQIKEIQTAWI